MINVFGRVYFFPCILFNQIHCRIGLIRIGVWKPRAIADYSDYMFKWLQNIVKQYYVTEFYAYSTHPIQTNGILVIHASYRHECLLSWIEYNFSWLGEKQKGDCPDTVKMKNTSTSLARRQKKTYAIHQNIRTQIGRAEKHDNFEGKQIVNKKNETHAHLNSCISQYFVTKNRCVDMFLSAYCFFVCCCCCSCFLRLFIFFNFYHIW